MNLFCMWIYEYNQYRLSCLGNISHYNCLSDTFNMYILCFQMQCSQWVENAQWKDSSESSDLVKEICVLSQKLYFYWGRKLLDFVHHMISDAQIVRLSWRWRREEMDLLSQPQPYVLRGDWINHESHLDLLLSPSWLASSTNITNLAVVIIVIRIIWVYVSSQSSWSWSVSSLKYSSSALITLVKFDHMSLRDSIKKDVVDGANDPMIG